MDSPAFKIDVEALYKDEIYAALTEIDQYAPKVLVEAKEDTPQGHYRAMVTSMLRVQMLRITLATHMQEFLQMKPDTSFVGTEELYLRLATLGWAGACDDTMKEIENLAKTFKIDLAKEQQSLAENLGN